MDWTPWVELGLAVVSGLAICFAFYVNATVDSKIEAAIDAQNVAGKAQRDLVIDHDRRIITLENASKVLPTKDDVHRLELSIERLTGAVSTVNSNMEHLAKSSTSNGAKLDRLEQQFYEREGVARS